MTEHSHWFYRYWATVRRIAAALGRTIGELGAEIDDIETRRD